MAASKRKSGVSVLRILDKSIAEIKAGRWVCHDLCDIVQADKDTVKHMACAVGLVSLYSHSTTTVSWFNSFTGKYERVEYATYPEEIEGVLWTVNAIRTLNALIKTAPKEFKKIERLAELADSDYFPKTLKEATYEEDDNASVEVFVKNAIEKTKGFTVAEAQVLGSIVVRLNDSSIQTSDEALKWFKRARTYAIKQGWV